MSNFAACKMSPPPGRHLLEVEKSKPFEPQLAPTISGLGPSLVKSPKGRFLIGIAAKWDALRGKGVLQRERERDAANDHRRRGINETSTIRESGLRYFIFMTTQ